MLLNAKELTALRIWDRL